MKTKTPKHIIFLFFKNGKKEKYVNKEATARTPMNPQSVNPNNLLR
jgi:hypothetical protein